MRVSKLCEEHVYLSGSEDDSAMQDRIHQLEEQLAQLQTQLTTLKTHNENTKKDMKFFETVLLEEYHLLLQILGKDQSIQVHQISSE